MAETLDRLEFPDSWHNVVPFVGELMPELIVKDANAVNMFGSYSLRRYGDSNDFDPPTSDAFR